jgi:hypothetical protein
VTAIQHIMGLAVGIMIYRTALGRRCPAWVAVLASAPVLLDAYQVELEHLLVSDMIFMFLVVAAACMALPPASRRVCRLSWRRALAIGLLVAAAALTRTIGLPLIAVFAFFLLWYGRRLTPPGAVWRPVGVFLLGALVPLLAYGGWFYATYHRVGLVGANGVFLYARTMSFADCAIMRPPPDLKVLCDPRPPADRPPSQEYVWNADSPLVRLPGITFTRETDELAGRFAALAIGSQPLDYAASALTELGRAFAWGRPVYPDAEIYAYYQFPRTTPPPPGRYPATVGAEFAERYERGPIGTEIVEPYAGWLRTYQGMAFLPGLVLLVILLLPLMVRRGPSWSLPWVVAWTLLVVPAATAEFDYRYALPAVPQSCRAAALGTASRQDRK